MRESSADINIYKVEPYVVAADVYAVPPHVGRGGWTWYTGSAGWMYRLILESLLGLRLEVNKLTYRALHSLRVEIIQNTLPVSGDNLSYGSCSYGRRRRSNYSNSGRR